jgi:hypothetical protein
VPTCSTPFGFRTPLERVDFEWHRRAAAEDLVPIAICRESPGWEASKMDQVLRTDTQVISAEPSTPGVSWAAVLAGAVASLSLTLVLLAFGAVMGFSVVSPWANSGVTATTFKIEAGLYFIVMAMISSRLHRHG